MLRIREYVKVQSVQEGYELLTKNRQNRILGGLLWLRQQNIQIPMAIDLSECGLNTIEENEDEFVIGAMVTLRDLEMHEGINEVCDSIIAKSVKSIVGVQFRNLATVGGSIYSRFGFSDILTSLLVLPVDVILHKRGRVSLKEFVNMPYERDILTHIVLSKKPRHALYFSERRSATDFPVLTIAISKEESFWEIAIGARPKKAMLLSLREEEIEKALNQVEFDSNLRGSKEYRRHLASVLIQRGIKEWKEKWGC